MSDEQEFLLDDEVTDHFDRVFGDAGGGDVQEEEEVEVDEPIIDEESDDEPQGETSDEHEEPVSAEEMSLYLGGQEFSRTDVEQLVTWAAGLSAEEMQRIEYALAHQQEETPVVDSPPEFDMEDVLDPELAKYVNQQFQSLNEEIASLREAQMSQIQIEQTRERQLLESAFEEARTGVAEKLGLSQSDAESLIERTNQSGIVTFLSQQKGLGAPVALFAEALETTYWATPEFRERSLTKQAEVVASEQRDLDAKKARASSVSGTSATASRSKSNPQTSDERFSAMVQEIAQEIGR